MEKEEKIKIGLFGGTFAPPHLGHVNAARLMLKYIPIERLIVMPAFLPPHKVKAGGDTPEERMKMCQAAFSVLDRVKVSDYEIKKGGLSYSVETLRYFTSLGYEVYMLCGTDMFLSLPCWFCADEIFRLANIVCVPRNTVLTETLEKAKKNYTEKYSANVTIIPERSVEMSSTEIRERIQSGESLCGLISDEVEEIIKNDKLYTR